MRWKLEEIARKEEKKGNRIWIEYGRISIDGIWWKWNKEKEVLRDVGKGKIIGEGEREGKGHRGSKVKKKGGGEERRKEGREGDKRVAFWNMAGLSNEDKGFWEKLREWDIMRLLETWCGERNWGILRERLPEGYIWEVQWVVRKK